MAGEVKHKKGTKAVAFSEKNSKGRSYKINVPSVSDSGGDPGQRKTGKAMTRHGLGIGTNSTDKQNPRKQRNRKIEAWCEGGKDYK